MKTVKITVEDTPDTAEPGSADIERLMAEIADAAEELGLDAAARRLRAADSDHTRDLRLRDLAHAARSRRDACVGDVPYSAAARSRLHGAACLHDAAWSGSLAMAYPDSPQKRDQAASAAWTMLERIDTV